MKISNEEAIQAVMNTYQTHPTREPGWVDSLEMAEAWGIATKNAVGRLEKLVRDGKAVDAYVFDPSRSRVVRVWKLVV